MATTLRRLICPLRSPTTSATSRTTYATRRTFFLRLAHFSVAGRSYPGRKPGVTGALAIMFCLVTLPKYCTVFILIICAYCTCKPFYFTVSVFYCLTFVPSPDASMVRWVSVTQGRSGITWRSTAHGVGSTSTELAG